MAATTIERYSRQLLLKGWSLGFQSKLKSLSVAIEAPLEQAILYALAGGIGTIHYSGPLSRALQAHVKNFAEDSIVTSETSFHLLQQQVTCSITFDTPISAQTNYRIDRNSRCVFRDGELFLGTDIYSDLLYRYEAEHSTPSIGLWAELSANAALCDFFDRLLACEVLP